jgi:hypothetical protein
VNATSGFKYPLLAPIGFVDDGHASGTGHKMGGIFQALAKGGTWGYSKVPGGYMNPAGQWVMGGQAAGNRFRKRRGFKVPYLGAMKKGGITRKDGLAHLHKHEAVLPLKKGGRTRPPNYSSTKTGILGTRGSRLRDSRRAKSVTLPTTNKPLRVIGFKNPRDARGNPLTAKQIRRSFPMPAVTPPVVIDTGDSGGDGGDQDYIDALAASTAATEELTRIQGLVNAQQDVITANQAKILAMAPQSDQIIAAIVAAVNGGIGGKTGLGFQSVSYPGGAARYR